MTGLRLDYVALAARDPVSLADLLGGALGLPALELPADPSPVPGFVIGEATLAVFNVGDPRLDGPGVAGVHHLGLSCPDPSAALGDAGLATAGTIDAGVGGRQWVPDAAPCAGVRLRFGHRVSSAEPGCSDHVERIDHIGVASTDNRLAEALFAGRLGFEVESRQTDMEVRSAIESFTSDRYGVVHHARTPEAVGGLRVSFVTVGDCELEFLEEFDPEAMSESRQVALGARPGTTRQDQGAIGRFIERRGAGLHHLAIKTPDVDGVLEALRGDGVRTIDAVGRPGSRRARIGFIHPSASGGVLIHFVERVPLD